MHTRHLLSALLAAVALAACEDDPTGTDPSAIQSGTLGGHAFTVVSGTVLQFGADGPLYSDDGAIVFDQDPAGLGMSDPDLLHLRTRFALSNGGRLQIAAFGADGSELSTGLWVQLERTGSVIAWDFRLAGVSFADSVFNPPPPPPIASGGHWVVTEFYADSVPRYPAGESGIAMWELNDTTPSFQQDVLGCTKGPATDPTPATGDRVAYALESAWLLTIQVRNSIVGPCM